MSQTEYESTQSEKRSLLLNSEDSKDNSQTQVSDNDNNNDEVEEIIPIWGEQIIIDKKMTKLGEIVIKKSKISEKRKVDLEVRKEKVTVKYPAGEKEEII